MITTTLRIDVTRQNQKDVVRLFRSLIGPTSVETGCISCHLYNEVDSPNVVTWVERWQSQDDLERHLKSPQYMKILTAIEMADAEPEIRFDTVVATSGMQLIAEARGVESCD